MGALRKNLPANRGIALRFIALTFFLSIMAAPARSETVPVEPAPPTATVQSVGAWFFPSYVTHLSSGIASLFNGYPTGQAACDAYDVRINSTIPTAHAHSYFVLIPDYTDQGLCLPYPSYSQWAAGGYLGGPLLVANYQHCPTGYRSNDPRIGGPSSATFTCTNNGTAKQCPAVAAGETPFTLDPGGLTCSRPDQCPVTPLTQPPFSDECSNSLEEGKGYDVNSKCGTLREPDMVDAAACIAKKINALSTPKINYSGPSATIRTAEYQNHLREIWDKSEQLNTIMNSVVFTPETKQACMQRKVEVDGEKNRHGIKSRPSSAGDSAPHVEHRAIDVPFSVANALKKQVTLYTSVVTKVKGKTKITRVVASDVEDYIHSATVNPPACDSRISWGGRFNPIDLVHFQLPSL